MTVIDVGEFEAADGGLEPDVRPAHTTGRFVDIETAKKLRKGSQKFVDLCDAMGMTGAVLDGIRTLLEETKALAEE